MSDYPAVIPMIAYANGPAAMDWLTRVFDFRERERRCTGARLPSLEARGSLKVAVVGQ